MSDSPVLSAAAEVRTLADLARLLRQLRRREARRDGTAQLTYRELAARTGWSRGAVGEYFGGNMLPPTDRFDVLIRLLGATAAEQGQLATARDRVEESRRRGRTPAPPRPVPHITHRVPLDALARAVAILLATAGPDDGPSVHRD